MKIDVKIFLVGLLISMVTSCREPYDPPAINANLNYLVVDGLLNTGDSTVITLSRTRNFSDTSVSVPETGAQITVVGDAADSYAFTEEPNGRYISNLNLNPAEKYQLKIATIDGKQYTSDPVVVKETPPIDSVNWTYDNNGVHIYANTHDPSNNTRYYRWEYQEVWEYHAAFDSYLIYSNGLITTRPTNQHVFACWQTHNSTELLLATSSGLSQDLIYQMPIMFVPRMSQQISVKYSILVKQFALTQDAYDFWQNQKKNTELTGSIFAPQPSQTNGNLHCISNPGEPVLGFISASSVQEQRIFISNGEVFGWDYPFSTCKEVIVTPDSVNFYFKELGYYPVDTYGIADYYGALPSCADCTFGGGTPIKPPFWP
jgi:hypothetical protein